MNFFKIIMTEDNENSSDKTNDAFVRKFQSDFIAGAITFLTVAAMVRGEEQSGDEIFTEMMRPMVGNRNPNRTGFDTIMPELYKKVIDYCAEAIVISESIGENEME